MYRFHVMLHAAGATNEAADSISPNSTAPRAFGSLSLSFDEACTRLAELPGMFVEPDGSFVWRQVAPPAWQVEGDLREGRDGLDYVELKGSCPAAEFDQLLTIFGWPRTLLVFQMVREGAFVDEDTFRAATSSAAT